MRLLVGVSDLTGVVLSPAHGTSWQTQHVAGDGYVGYRNHSCHSESESESGSDNGSGGDDDGDDDGDDNGDDDGRENSDMCSGYDDDADEKDVGGGGGQNHRHSSAESPLVLPHIPARSARPTQRVSANASANVNASLGAFRVPVPAKGNGLFGGLSRHQKRVLKMQRQWAAKVTAETISIYHCSHCIYCCVHRLLKLQLKYLKHEQNLVLTPTPTTKTKKMADLAQCA